MPVQIIRRPDFLGDAIRDVVADAQEKARADEERHRIAEAKRKRLLTMGLGAAAGAGVGLLAAPALGLAGAAGAAGVDAAAVGLGGIPAGAAIGSAGTVGALGVGGTLSAAGALTAGLTGAQIGAQVGSGIDDGDFTPALASAANLTRSIVRGRELQQVFGYEASPQDQAAFAREAIQQGTNLGKMMQVAKSGGPTVPQQLAASQAANLSVEQLDRMARDENFPVTGRQLAAVPEAQLPQVIQGYRTQAARQRDEQQYQDAYQSKRGAIDAQLKQDEADGIREFVQDKDEIARIEEEAKVINRKIDDYEQNGGISGTSFEENLPRLTELDGLLRTARRGKSRPVPPKIPIFDETGRQISEVMPGITRFQGGGERAIEPTKDGYNVKYHNPDASMRPLRVQTPQGIIEVDADVYKDAAGSTYTRSDIKHIAPQVAVQEARINEFLKKATEPRADGTTLAGEPEEFYTAFRAVMGIEPLAKAYSSVAAMMDRIGTGALTPQEVDEVGAKLLAIPGIEADGGLVDMFKAARDDANRNFPPAPPPEAIPAPPPPPPEGSAASAETEIEAVRRRIKEVPMRKQLDEEAAADRERRRLESLAPEYKRAADKLAKENELRVEKITLRNLEAGFHDEIGFLDSRMNWHRSLPGKMPTTKGQLTPEVIAAAHALGWTVPGLEPD